MVALQFGRGAYKRNYAGAPEIQLLNRFIERMPSNFREKMGLLARAGTGTLAYVPPNYAGAVIRRFYSKRGLFNNDLFIVSGNNLYRYLAASPGGLIQIQGVIGDSGVPKFAYDSGPGYQHLFVTDGELLQVYKGGTQASGTLTGTPTSQVIKIGTTYYSWNASVNTGPPDGTSAHPWLANPGSDAFTALANMLDFIGTPGVDFSSGLAGANTQVTASAHGGPPATSVVLQAISDMTDGNSIATTIFSGSGISFSTATLTGGGVQTLYGVYMPTGQAVNGICTLDHYVMVSIAGSNVMYFIEPGDVVVDPLNFFAKEANPDPIADLCTIGDTFLAAGTGSIETWYPTGDLNAPFAPIEGQTVSRGIVDGSLVNVQDTPIFVANDGIVYAMVQGVLQRISDNGIEERIRRLLRTTAGLSA